MKSVDEVRKLMTNTKVLDTLEEYIVDAARRGEEDVDVFIDTDICSWKASNVIVKRLIDLGYKCESTFIGDQRDGDSIKFSISWKEDD